MNRPLIPGSVRFKLISIYAVMIFAGSIIGGYISIRIAENGFRDVLRHQFESTINVTGNFIGLLGQTGMILAGDIASDGELEKLMAGGRSKALSDHVSALMKRTGADALVLVDGEGRVITRGHDNGGSSGESLASVKLVRDTLAQKASGSAIIRDNGRFVVYSSGVINGQRGAAGAVLIGYVINDRFLDNVKKNTNVDITLVRDGMVEASTIRLGEKRMQALPVAPRDYRLLPGKSNDLIEAELFGKSFFIAARRLEGLDDPASGSMLLAYPSEGFISIRHRLYKQFILLFFLGFVIAITVGVQMADRILRPIRYLIGMTRKISRGELDTRLATGTGDEFDTLANHFNSMMDSIRDKDRELKSYSEGLELEVQSRTAELRAANEELRMSEERLAEAERISHLGNWDLEIVTNELRCSEEFYRIFGLAHGEISTGAEFLDLIHPEDRALVEGAVEQAIFDGMPFSLDHRIVLADGSVRAVHDRGEVFFGPSGAAVRILGTVHDITGRKMMEDELERLAKTDRLTGAYNRTKLEEIMARETDMARRYGQKLSLIIFDIDHFKKINDEWGHAAGDEALKTIAGLVAGVIRRVDYLVRWGGEEFMIVAPEMDLAGAAALSERIREEIEGFGFDRAGRITVSLGAAEFRKGEDNLDFIKRADNALYEAKAMGRNRVELSR
ncbi:MAG: diguanylate cyclase [Deltaproteobacteria bacterium]|nr:diguanylate cyclase [Deltaproteobacteria bacterium]